MPTYTGVCSWGELSTVLTGHLEDSQIRIPSTPYVYDTGDVLFASVYDGSGSIISSPWPSDPLQGKQIVEAFVESNAHYTSVYIAGWDGVSWTTLWSSSSSYKDVMYLPNGITQLQVRAITNPMMSGEYAQIKVQQCFIIQDDCDVAISNTAVYWTQGVAEAIRTRFSPYNCAFSNETSSYPVQYILRVGENHIILVVQGIYQVHSSAMTHIVYAGQLDTPAGAPTAYAFATSMGDANLTATLSNNRRANIVSTYNIYQSQAPVSPDIQNRFALVPIYVYHPDENWRGWFKDLYVAEIPPQTMLNGETITAQDGSKYTFFNIPPSGDGYYNNFLASGDTNKWLVIKH